MNAHIITIGDELLIGQTVNTNASYIGTALTNIRIKIKKTSVVGDNKSDILKEFDEAWSTSDLIIVTGGLGPTHDDITLQCVADYFKTELVMNNEVLENVRRIFNKRAGKLLK
jgi:nicotinamide-nucleotide amidase